MERPGKRMKPSHGHRLIIDTFDGIAASDPSRAFVFIPRTSNASDGWKAVSFREMSRAVDEVAWKITNECGPGFQETFPTLAYIGPNDVRYLIVCLACIKAGYKALFLSPRNSKEAQQSLLNATDCGIFWHTENYGLLAKLWVGDRDITTGLIPTPEALFESDPPHFPYSRTFDQGRWDPAAVLHTSGTTGLPKPIVVRQGSLIIGDAMRDLPKHHGGEIMVPYWSELAQRFFLPMPLFHAAALFNTFIAVIWYNTPVALGFPDKPLNTELAAECLKYAGVQAALLPPVIVEDLAQQNDGLELLKQLKCLVFGGGNMSQQTGQILRENGVVMCNSISSTECAPYIVHFQHDLENWQYFIFNDKAMGCHWKLYSEEDNLYELVLRRNDPKDPGLQPIFYTFPDVDEWSTKDLYKPHPTLPEHWRYCGRIDDVIVFSNGEKLNPVTMEEIIGSHPSLNAALVVGRDRFQPALVLDPVSPCNDEASKSALIEEVWPLVEKANKETVAHGHLVKWLIMVAPSGKSFMRTPKGTILRAPTVRQFDEEIEVLYRQQEANGNHESVELDLASETTLTKSITALVVKLTGIEELSPETDLFSVGFDSLKVVSAVKMLKKGLEDANVQLKSELAPRLFYENPTAALLSKRLYSAIHQDGLLFGLGAEEEKRVIEELLSKYTNEIQSPKQDRAEPLSDGQTILITGTTGSLGAYLLDRLCQLESVSKVIALNRGNDGGASRQPSVSSARGLNTDFAKVEFLRADLALPELGLDPAKFAELSQSVDRIIHNAWPVNFNINVSTFEPHIRGVRHLVDFSATAKKTVPIVFVSSVGTAAGWTGSEPVPEERLDDFALSRMGYGQSKLLGSLILDAAASKGIPTASVRVGQIAGPKSAQGFWNRQEFIPSLIASSLYLGALPNHLGHNQTVDWMPIEDVANILLDIAGATGQVQASQISGYFHAVNPITIEWPELAATVQSYYSDRIEKMTSLEDWISLLEKSSSKMEDIEKNPGLKLLDTYRAMLTSQKADRGGVAFSMQRTETHSPSARRLQGITPTLMENWCRQWEF